MKAIVYERTGDPSVLQLVDRPLPEPGAGEVLVRIVFSGVNPTDWKARRQWPLPAGWQTPGQDGAGIIEAVGAGVAQDLIGERVWIWEAAWQRPWGTAAEYTVVPVRQVVRLGDGSFELGASLGIPFLTAHRCLTAGEYLPDGLRPGALSDHAVLVQGGAGAVGNAAIQLAAWADACVIATVSSAEKAQLAAAAGASFVINYREQDVVAEVRKVAPDGVHGIVEVAAARNAATDVQLLHPGGVVCVYADDGGDEVTLPIRPLMTPNARWQFVLVYTLPKAAKAQAVMDVAAAAAQGGIRVGEEAGLPLHRYPLSAAAAAHQAVEDAVVGKVLISAAD
ncbi:MULTISPECIES: NADPH:quinone reductase [Micromonospora]|uniref:NADPH:quinone reductase n=1 Tax=Micromonospora maris TaxID=1003110 RepID=A0A9X0I6F3_9ACTN|nr:MULTISPECIES: NADPH:quinone reductase [Micromonospora]AEB42422.1 alcohol dehydrogenase zinc-binding domain protein [Micromonospora maris AB-18-032]KUJ47889.1 NADPH:quinone reductase [Micromonospora maris]RUL91101.1 NADPH:quinone reductase [Verrucosispora sp. FIM060022]